jgi:hypothetical protein
VREHTKHHEKIANALPADQAREMVVRFEALLEQQGLPRCLMP